MLPNPMSTLTALRSCALAFLLGHVAWGHAQSAAGGAPAEPALDVEAYVIDGDNPLSAEETRAVLQPFVGKARALRDIEAASAAMETLMRKRGFAFHRMFIPVQKPSDGQIHLQVIGIKLGTVEVTGNEKFTTDNIRRSLTSLREGEVPEVQTLGRDVTASNTNPAKQVSVTFKESAQPGQVDAVVKVKDSPTLAFFTSLTGNQALSGQGPANNVYRLTAGVQHANLFDRDHVATLSYTTDPGNFSNVGLFGAYYQIPLYGTGMNLSASYTSSDVSSGRVQQGAGVFDVSGSGRFSSVTLTRALARVDALQQTVGIAFDERLFRNKTTFNGAKIQPDVGSRVLALRYGFRNEPSWGDLAGSVEYATNVGGGPGNSVADHAANGGIRNWSALRFGVEAGMAYSGWQLAGRLKGQSSDTALVPGEQFGLGGANSVRGFSDRVVSGDYGFQWNLEATGPGMGNEQIRPVVFLEGGHVYARSTGVGDTLVSGGVGMRWNRQSLQVALDLAQVFDAQRGALSERPVRMHLAMSYRF
jgi:hemolysin activation/secretion protein